MAFDLDFMKKRSKQNKQKKQTKQTNQIFFMNPSVNGNYAPKS